MKESKTRYDHSAKIRDLRFKHMAVIKSFWRMSYIPYGRNPPIIDYSKIKNNAFDSGRSFSNFQILSFRVRKHLRENKYNFKSNI